MFDTTEDVSSTIPCADPEVVGLFEAIFDEYREQRSPPTADVDFDRRLWDRLDSLGLTRLTGDEGRGGSGASWMEASALLGLSAGAAAPIPIAEHDLLAGWLLEVAGLPEQEGPMTACQPNLDGISGAVPWGRNAASVVALWQSGTDTKVYVAPRAEILVQEARNIAGEPSDTIQFQVDDLRTGVVVDQDVATEYRLRGALARSSQIAGGMARVVDVVLGHVNERTQFGRSIGKFQAVQTLVADLAAEAALTRSATDFAIARVAVNGWSDPGLPFAVAVARSCAGHGSSIVVRNAHQALGAIGATMEHELPRLTKPILARRRDFGSVHEWDSILSTLATAAGRDGLWDLITASRLNKSFATLLDENGTHP